ncbi:transcription factor Adf-1-like [Myripristis murdjan]|uniref:transcription factor Adf-1-like n=1 Tax=Myripristis murdjan TaxID=586833 RepID=UPI001175EB78|nr:transcription factor Adf-1-like [Myripristis murdjan]
MANFDDRLAEEVRKHPALYDSSSKGYKDTSSSVASWREIAQTLQIDENVCRQKWKNLRDKFVRAKRKVETRSGDGRKARVPCIVTQLHWLSTFVRHRETESHLPHSEETEESVSGPTAESLQTPPGMSSKCSKSPAAVEVSLSPLSEDEVDHMVPLSSSSSGSTSDRPRPAIAITPPPPPPPPSEPHFRQSHMSSLGRRRQRKRRLESIDEFILKRLESIDQHREELLQFNDEDTRFALSMADILRRLPQRQRSLAKFKIHQLLFEIEQEHQD